MFLFRLGTSITRRQRGGRGFAPRYFSHVSLSRVPLWDHYRVIHATLLSVGEPREVAAPYQAKAAVSAVMPAVLSTEIEAFSTCYPIIAHILVFPPTLALLPLPLYKHMQTHTLDLFPFLPSSSFCHHCQLTLVSEFYFVFPRRNCLAKLNLLCMA